jgi:hypothetical protein
MALVSLIQLQPPDNPHRAPNTNDGLEFGANFQQLVNAVNADQLGNFRNFIDGGDFTINPFQRNCAALATTNFLTSAISNSTGYFADRFFGGATATSAVMMGKVGVTAVPGFSQALQFGRNTSDTHTTPLYLGQVLEGLDSIRMQGQWVCLSFWAQTVSAYSGGALTVTLVASTTTGADDTAAHLIAGSTNWSTGAASPAVNVINTTQTLTSSWQRYYFTGFVPTGTQQVGFYVSYTPTGTAPANTNDAIQFMGFQLEIVPANNTPPSNFEHRDIEVELCLCQRYYWNIPEPASGVIVASGHNSGTNAQTFYCALPQTMRAAPTVTTTVGSFKVNSATAGVVAATGLTASGTHTVNAVGLASTGTGTAGQGATLQGGGASGVVQVSADY